MRTKSYRYFQREKHIKRKEHILHDFGLDNPPHKYNYKDCDYERRGDLSEGEWTPYWRVKHRGQLNKGKIHCSCGMCMSKTRNKKRRHVHGNYAPSINYKPGDLRKIQRMDLKNFD